MTPRFLRCSIAGGMAEAGVGAAQLLRDVGVQLGEAAHVRLVDDGLAPGRLGRPVVAPVEAVVDDDALGDAGGAVALVDRQVGVLIAGGAEL